MAASGQREAGRESTREKKPQSADNDIQQRIGHEEEECLPQSQWGCSILKPENPQPPHIKEEECLLGAEEADLIKLQLTGVSVKTEYHEDKPPESSCRLCPSAIQPLIANEEERPPHPQEGRSTLKQEDPQPPHVKEEQEELWITQEGECLLGPEEPDLTKLPLTVVCVKTEDHEEEPQVHRLLAPLSDSDDMSPSPEDTQEPLSSDTDRGGHVRTHADKCSKKKTRKKHLTCTVCAKAFSQKGHLTQHMRTHTGEKPFSCSVCEKRFSVKSNMVSHMRTHTGEKPFCCSVCSKRFSHKGAMLIHTRTHTGKTPFCCSVCGESFCHNNSLSRHMSKHTGEKPFICSVCGKRFTQKPHMISHMRTHTGEKPYSCSVCGKIFSHDTTLRSHMRTHTGEQPFSCSVCGKTFSQKPHMITHLRTHTGEKPFSCSVCGKTFSQKSNMVSHRRKHSREKASQIGPASASDEKKIR